MNTMLRIASGKKMSLLALLAFLLAGSGTMVRGQVPIQYYDFEDNGSRTNFENTAEQVINVLHATDFTRTGSALNSFEGAGVFHHGAADGIAASSNKWIDSPDDPGTEADTYYEFVVNTKGFKGITLDFDDKAATGGPASVGVLYSLDGTNFSAATTAPQSTGYTLWNTVAPFELPDEAGDTVVTIRIYAYAGDRTDRDAFSSTGALRVDNVTVYASGSTGGVFKTLLNEGDLYTSVTSGLTDTILTRGSFTVGVRDTIRPSSNLNFSGVLLVNGLFSPANAFQQFSGSGFLRGSGTVEVKAAQGDSTTNDFLNQYTLVPRLNNLTVQFIGNDPQYAGGTGVNITALNVTIGNPAGVSLIKNLTVPGTLTLDSGALYIKNDTLTLNGPVVTNLGTLAGSDSSSLIINGNAGTLSFTEGSGVLKNFTVNDTASAELGTPLFIAGGTKPGTMTVDGTVATNDQLTLRSNAGGTASVGTSAGIVTGNVTVERYIPARRSWRYITSPLSSAGPVFTEWQNNGVADGKTGVEIWSPLGTGPTGNGLDKGGSDVSIEHFDSALNTFVNLTDTKTAPLSGTAGTADNIPYAVFITGPYGDVDHISANNGAAFTTIKATGKLQIGDQSFNYGSNLPAGNFIMMANPYASAVYAGSITKNNVGNTFWAWDPNLGTRGAYATVSFDALSGSFTITPSGTTQTANIENGQAVLVQVKAANQPTNVLFTESGKVMSNAPVFGKQANSGTGKAAAVSQELRITLNRKDATLNNYNFADEVVAQFNNGYSNRLGDDASKLYGYDENMSLVHSNAKLTILRRPIVKKGDTLFLNIDYLKQNTGYNFNIQPTAFPGAGVSAYLVDSYLNTSSPVSLTAESTISFTTTGETRSYNAKRFVIVLQPAEKSATLIAAATESKANDSKAALNVYPNPIKDYSVSVYLNKLPAGNYNFVLYTNEGRQLLMKEVTLDNLQATYTLQLPAGTASGTYTLVLKGADGRQYQQQIAVQH